MFRRFTDRISSALGGNSQTHQSNPVQALVSMGFDASSARQALSVCDNNVDRAAEWLLSHNQPAAAAVQMPVDNDQATIDRIMQESIALEEERQFQEAAATSASTAPVVRTAAMRKAAEAATSRAQANVKPKTKKMSPPRSKPTPAVVPPQRQGRSNSGGLATHHPDVKIIPKLQDKSKEEQILRCADRLKSSPQAVETLIKSLTAIQREPGNNKFRRIDRRNPGFQRSLANAPGAEDLLKAMNFRLVDTHFLVMDSFMIDPGLLYLGISALEQARLTPEYKEAKEWATFEKEVAQIRTSATTSGAPTPPEPAPGQGALMQVTIASETVRRRFDGDDTLADVLNWLGGYGSGIVERISDRSWSLVDKNRYPMVPMDCAVHKDHTLQYIGCWPSGKLAVVPSSEEWKQEGEATITPGSIRGLASGPSEMV